MESAPYPNKAFDVVTMFDVLEHTRDPIACLQEIRRVLTDDGFVAIRVPDVGGLLPRLCHSVTRLTRGRYSKPFRLLWQVHRWGFNGTSLQVLSQQSGFVIHSEYGEDAQDLGLMDKKDWARSVFVRLAVRGVVTLSHWLRLWDERVVVLSKDSGPATVGQAS
jgi:SAM-dependent methyltransferase